MVLHLHCQAARLRLAWETHLLGYLRVFQRSLRGKRGPTLDVGSAIPWAGISDRIQSEQGDEYQHLAHSAFWLKMRWPATNVFLPPWLITVILDCLPLNCKPNYFLPQIVSGKVFVTTVRKLLHIKHSPRFCFLASVRLHSHLYIPICCTTHRESFQNMYQITSILRAVFPTS